MKQIIYRKNKMFIIDTDQFKSNVKKDEISNALYAAIYLEFIGANENPHYKNMTSLQKLEEVNSFAYKWLLTRGLV